MILSCDIETYSSEDLKKCGAYKYASSDDFEILLFAYAYDDQETQIVDLKKDKLPEKLVNDLKDPKIIKSAYNAQFERICLSKHLNVYLEPKQWRCTLVHAATLGLPMSLGKVAEVLELQEGKIKEGDNLIRYFCKPCKPTKVNGGRTRNLPEHNEEKWDKFKEYCVRDVDVEKNIRQRLDQFPMDGNEIKLMHLDWKINDTGVEIDTELVENAILCDKMYKKKIEDKVKEITNVDNPNSLIQLKTWFKENGLEVTSLDKKTISELLNTTKGNIREVLEYRQELGKTSVKKYEAMKQCVGKHNRVRGILQFYGANRTGRWAGRLVQVQNLPQNHFEKIEEAREVIRSGNFDKLNEYDINTPNLLSEMIRTTFIPRLNNKFIVIDFSAIEARVLAWLAGEDWRLEVFKTHGKIYEASASQMFKVPIESITKDSPLRQKGKIAELALGYQGGFGAMVSMGALEKGLTENEVKKLIKDWRSSNPNIKAFWNEMQQSAVNCIKYKSKVETRYFEFTYEKGIMFIKLPSGRKLSYCNAKLKVDEKNKTSIEFMGMNNLTKKWEGIPTYGGKLTENVVQAVSRDILGEAMIRLNEIGYRIVMHVHDEVVLEVKHSANMKHACAVMCELPKWANGLPMDVDGFESEFYKK